MIGNYYRFLAIGHWISLQLLVMPMWSACGQDPAFLESSVASADASQTGDPADGSQSTSTDEQSESTSNNGGASESGGAGGEDSSDPVYVPPTGYPAGTKESDVLVEDGGTLVLPGVKAVKVGVNFEDLSDFDLNDSVLCFTGDFKIQGANVVSYKKQTIVAAVTNNSACGHNIRITIKDKAGAVTQRIVYDDRVTRSATMNFDVGSTLWVVMENQPNSQGCIGPIAMNHATRAEVKPNLCRK